MPSHRYSLTLLLSLASFLSLAVPSLAAPGDPTTRVLRLKRGEIQTRSASAPTSDTATAGGAESTVRLVQMRVTPDATLRARLESAGATVLGYVPDDALVVRTRSGATLAAIRSLPGLHWEGRVEGSWKISPELGSRPYVDPTRRAGGLLLAVIDLWDDADAAAFAALATARGADVRAVFDEHGVNRVVARAALPLLRELALVDDVAWIEEAPEATTRNDAASWVIQSNALNLRPIWDKGIRGEGQIIGNIDGRLDMNSCYVSDPGQSPGPAHRKVIAYRSSNGQGADSHGTHTNGTMAGDSGTPGEHDPGDGHAFAAKIVFANLSDIDGSGSAPSNLAQYLALAHGDGARVHTNSWGDDGTTAYTSWSRDIDVFSWDNEDSLVLFAVTNGSSLKTPENAKNVLAVGATEREGNAGNHCSGGRGPTSDGRRKPEIYAPGCSTVSAASGQTCGTRSLTGTSMASPAVAGAAALVRQYFVEGWYPSGVKSPADALIPSGALMKAVLVSGAVDMTGVGGYPSDLEGWGRVHLERSLYFAGDARGLVVLDDVRRSAGLRTDEERTYALEVVDGTQDLRVTLAFTEPPAALLASSAAINDLDLRVTAPDGTLYLGNVTDGNGSSVPGGTADARNNLEQVLIASPQVGTWTVTVRARAVPLDAQGFALAATGGVETAAVGVRLRYDGHRLQDTGAKGNGNGTLDPGETITIPVTLRNAGDELATGVVAGLRVDRPEWARVVAPEVSYPDLGPGVSAESIAPHYELVLFPEAACGERLTLHLTPRTSAGPVDPAFFTIDIGDSDRDFVQSTPLPIPKSQLGFVESSLVVTDAVNVRDLDVSVRIEHGNVGELRLALFSPSGTQVVLHDRSRPGQVDLNTRFDRDRPVDGPGALADFVGEPAAGTWRLVIGDALNTPIPAGRLVQWTLHVTADRALECAPLTCADPRPGTVAGLLLLDKSGLDLAFSWPAQSGAAGYHVLSATDPGFDAPELVGRTAGATLYTAAGGASGEAGSLTLYQVRATNTCSWEGP